MTRRDKCYLVAARAQLLSPEEAAVAWAFLVGQLDGMAEQDIPKFAGLLSAIRRATIYARQSQLKNQKSKIAYKDPEIAAFAEGFAKLEREAALGRQTISDLKASADYDLE